MLIAHCADLHLNSPLKTHLDSKHSDSRKKELLNSFRNMIRKCDEMGVEVVLISGDLFDEKTSPNKLALELIKIFKNYSRISFIYCVGNHDSVNVFLDEDISNLYVCNNSWKKFSYDNVDIYGINFNDISSGYLYDTLVTDGNRKNIVMIHGEAKESGNSSDIINLKKLANKGIDYLALGHIHKRSITNLDSRGIAVYPGCLEGRGFDEDGMKGFYIIDTSDIKNPKFVENSIRVIHRLEYDLSLYNTYDEFYDKLKNDLITINEDDIVGVYTSGKYKTTFEKRFDYLESELNNYYYFAKVKDTSTLSYDKDTFKDDNSIIGYFYRTVLYSSESEEMKQQIIEYGINALKGEN